MLAEEREWGEKETHAERERERASARARPYVRERTLLTQAIDSPRFSPLSWSHAFDCIKNKIKNLPVFGYWNATQFARFPVWGVLTCTNAPVNEITYLWNTGDQEWESQCCYHSSGWDYLCQWCVPGTLKVPPNKQDAGNNSPLLMFHMQQRSCQ